MKLNLFSRLNFIYLNFSRTKTLGASSPGDLLLPRSLREIDRTGRSVMCSSRQDSGSRNNGACKDGQSIGASKQSRLRCKETMCRTRTYVPARRSCAAAGNAVRSIDHLLRPYPSHQRSIHAPCLVLDPWLCSTSIAFGTDVHAVETGVEGVSPSFERGCGEHGHYRPTPSLHHLLPPLATSQPATAIAMAACTARSIRSKQGARANGRWRRAYVRAPGKPGRTPPPHDVTGQDRMRETFRYVST